MIRNIQEFDKHFIAKYILFAVCKELNHCYLNLNEIQEQNGFSKNFSFEDFLFLVETLTT